MARVNRLCGNCYYFVAVIADNLFTYHVGTLTYPIAVVDTRVVKGSSPTPLGCLFNVIFDNIWLKKRQFNFWKFDPLPWVTSWSIVTHRVFDYFPDDYYVEYIFVIYFNFNLIDTYRVIRFVRVIYIVLLTRVFIRFSYWFLSIV